MINVFSFIIIFFLKSIICWAHVPVFLERSTSLSQPYIVRPPFDKSIAIYTGFDHTDEVDVYQFTVEEQHLKKGEIEVLIGTLVPACEPLKNLLISWALTGPSQESLKDERDPEFLKKTVQGNGDGAFLMKNETQGKLWYEPYTKHHYFYQRRQKLNLRLPGVYKIFVWANSPQAGDYVLEFGDKEIWNLRDILYTFLVYPRLLLEREIKTKNCETSSLQ
jgi:hypothetical protein